MKKDMRIELTNDEYAKVWVSLVTLKCKLKTAIEDDKENVALEYNLSCFNDVVTSIMLLENNKEYI